MVSEEDGDLIDEDFIERNASRLVSQDHSCTYRTSHLSESLIRSN